MSRHFIVPQLSEEEAARFWAKAQKGDGCWPWTGGKNKLGYGRVKLDGKTYYAHRVAFALRHGDSADCFICHRCNNPACVNPDHLFNRLDNVGDGGPSTKRKKRKPAKPRPDFPLFAHATRRWAKKIKGKLHYFGPWADPDAALKKYLDQKDDLYAGRKPRVAGEGYDVATLCNDFLNSKDQKVRTGELTQRSRDDYEVTTDLIIGAFGRSRLVSDLTPADFAAFRAKLAKTRGPVTLGNTIQRIRVVFNYAYKNCHIPAPVRYGQGFERPSKKTLRLNRAAKGPCMFEAAEIRRLLAAAGQPLRAMVLLGVNAGYGNADVGTLPLAALDLDAGWVNYHRPKTGISRRCSLWLETVEAIREALAKRPTPKNEADAGLAFITKYGDSWHKGTTDNPVSKEFSKLMKSLGLNGNRGFYALRHTLETIGGESRDQPAVDHIMGHARDDMASVYRERISDERLKAVTDGVRGWLFGGKAVTP